MQLIDTHAHLYLDEFDSDRAIMINRALQAGVNKFFLPNIDAGSIDSMMKLSKEYPDHCFPMMGLHPCSVKENWENEISKIHDFLFNKSELRFYGVGETGLDYYWDKTFIDSQKENFQLHIDWAKELGLPLIIHSRDSLDDCIDIIQRNKDERLQGIFHCFSGSLDQAQKVIETGFYLGIGGVVTFKNGGLDKVLPGISLSGIVLETDSPYLAPVPFRGKRNESSYIKYIIKKVAEIKNISEEEIATVTSENATKVFQI